MCYHAKKTDSMCYHGKKTVSICYYGRKTDSMCYHVKKTDNMCYHGKKTVSMCYHRKKDRQHVLSWKKDRQHVLSWKNTFVVTLFYKIVTRFYVAHISHRRYDLLTADKIKSKLKELSPYKSAGVGRLHTRILKERSSHRKCSAKKGVHNFTIFTGKNLCWSLFLWILTGKTHRQIKLQPLQRVRNGNWGRWYIKSTLYKRILN